MKRLAALLVLICFAATPVTGNSTQMFSLEKGNVYAESFNLNHILKCVSGELCFPYNQNPATFVPIRNYNHSHVILLNALSREYEDELSLFAKTFKVPVSFDSEPNRLAATRAHSGISSTSLKLLSPSRLPFQQFTVLLI